MDPATRHVSLVLVELGRAIKARSLLRAGEPRLEETLERAHYACAAELARAGVLELVMDGRLLRLGHGGQRLTIAPAVELARICKERGLLGIRLDKDLELRAFCALVESLADTPESQRPAGAAKRRNAPSPSREIDRAEIEAALEGSVEQAIEEADPIAAVGAQSPAAGAQGRFAQGRLDDALGEPLQEELPDALRSALPPAAPQEAIDAEPSAADAHDAGVEPDAISLDESAVPEPTAAAATDPADTEEDLPAPVSIARSERALPPAQGGDEADAHDETLAAVAPAAVPPTLDPVGPSATARPAAAGDELAEMLRLASDAADRRGRSQEARHEATTRLRTLATGPRVELLLQRACSDETPASLQASQVLLALGSELIPKLLDAIAAEKHPKRRGHLNGVLIAMGEAAAPHLVRELEIADPVRARTTAWLAGEIQHPAAVPALTGRLRGSDPVLRREAAKALAKISHPSAISILVQTLEGKDPELAALAAHCLAVSGRPHGLEAVRQRLHAACERNELPLAREMLLMLGRRGRADVVPDLVAILGRKSLLRRQSLRDLKIAALHALSKLPGSEARKALADIAANGDTTIRDAAQGALARRDRNEPPATPPPDALPAA